MCGRLEMSSLQHLARSCESPSDMPKSLALAGIAGRSPWMTLYEISVSRRERKGIRPVKTWTRLCTSVRDQIPLKRNTHL